MREEQRCFPGNLITKVLHTGTEPSIAERALVLTSRRIYLANITHLMYSLAFTDPSYSALLTSQRGGRGGCIGIQASRPIPSTCRSGSYLDSSPDKQACSLAVRAFRRASTTVAAASPREGVCVSRQPLGASGTGHGARGWRGRRLPYADVVCATTAKCCNNPASTPLTRNYC